MTISDSITLETAHTLWGTDRYNTLTQLATLMFNEWLANPERECDTWYGETDFDINMYDNLEGERKAILYFLKNASPETSEQHYDKFITVAEQPYAPLGFTVEQFEHIKEYAKTELEEFMSGTLERSWRCETQDSVFELCFDTCEITNCVFVELYKRIDGKAQYGESYTFTVAQLINGKS